MSQVCRFQTQPGGCRNGTKCRFSHTTGSNRSPPAQTPDRQTSNSSGVPSGVCRFYWTTGNCKQEFGCRFRHQASESGATSSRSRTIRPDAHSLEHFLTDAGLAKLSNPGNDFLFSPNAGNLTPNEAHNHIKRFLHDDFRFRSTLDVYAFLSALNNANTTNTAWTHEDGQLFFSSVASDNGLLRIGDIIRWSPVSHRAGSSRTDLSFQRGFLPLLQYMSSDYVVKSTLSHLINGLYLKIMDEFDHFSEVLQNCMEHMLQARTFKDTQLIMQRAPLGSQIFTSMATVLFECLTRFKNATATYPRLIPTVRKLHEWVDMWIKAISQTPPMFDDVLANTGMAARDHLVNHLCNKINRLVAIVDREQAIINRPPRPEQRSLGALSNLDGGILTALQNTYQGPGDDRPEGRRHDNDFVHIKDIRIAPTHGELVSRIPPFLPGNLHGAPHPFPAESMQRLLDIQFRLLREELTAPLRSSLQLVCNDFTSDPTQKTRLSDLQNKGGGKYRGHADGEESVMFNVYTSVEFSSLTPDRRGVTANLVVDAPPGRARSEQARARVVFWEGMSGKRLMQGGLVALVWKHNRDVAVHLGVIASSLRDLADSAKQAHGDERIAIRVLFFDAEVELRILQALKNPNKLDQKVLVEAPVMFEAIRPFLESMRVTPETVPFGDYLVHHPTNFFKTFKMSPPAYARETHFKFQLSSLFPPEAEVLDLKLTATDPASIEVARAELRRSRLDPSQADAVVDSLTREVALIQGPPGTGKSFTGVELLRVLLHNKVRPILMIAFTNHALDHLLCAVLDAGITTNMVRLGSRSADERISNYSIETLEMVAGKSRLDRAFGRHFRELKLVEDEIKNLMKNFSKTNVSSEEIVKYLELRYPEHFEHILNPPGWIFTIKTSTIGDEDDDWRRAGKGGKSDTADKSMYAYWRDAGDLAFLQSTATTTSSRASASKSKEQRPPNHNMYQVLSGSGPHFHVPAISGVPTHLDEGETSSQSDDESGFSDDESTVNPEEEWIEVIPPMQDAPQAAPAIPEAIILDDSSSTSSTFQTPEASPRMVGLNDLDDPAYFFRSYGLDRIPAAPSTNYDLEKLLDVGEMWSMSMPERRRLHQAWIEEIRLNSYTEHIGEFMRLRERHAEALKIYTQGKDETRRQLLQNMDIVGCTTTGAAKLTSLLKGLDPRVMLVEEAGQVLEAHILGTLVPSVEHMILIGDPQQLRPTLNNFSLSMDNARGSQLYKFDMSLMERLATSGMPMSQIDVQRRMRPEISSLIRNTLYPRLQDHDIVTHYPSVRGLSKNLFFFTHNHAENGGGEESASKYNTFEVAMIKDLVLYLLRQGCYSEEGDIVVLCAYLGQLARMRDALASEVAVVIDDRDQMALADQEDHDGTGEMTESAVGVERVKVMKRVRLRTIDNFQGEEAKIVILSLVRNSGVSDEDHAMHTRSNIGFLKSENRTNVALSRAKEGMYMMGNAINLASRSRMWRSVIKELTEKDCIGEGFPVACHRHPDSVQLVSGPGKLPQIAPDGGCLRSCDTRLRCGHLCPHKCHPDDPRHVSVRCLQQCLRHCSRGHPCNKDCATPCGDCQFPISQVELPCGHVATEVPCYLADSPGNVPCTAIVMRQLPNCEHEAQMMCYKDPAQHSCSAPCGGIMQCCGRDCHAQCSKCQMENNHDQVPVQRTKHQRHPCKKRLYCEHACKELCSQDHKCTTVCKERCRQICQHSRCARSCSDPCAPCMERCTWSCPHHSCPVPCGSVCARLPCDLHCEKLLQCGHRCPSVCGEDCSIQVCPLCASPGDKANVVDFIMQRTLEDVDPEQNTLDELLITLPECGHVFTVETLDGHCQMNDYYTREGLDGRWLALGIPPLDSRQPPTCPTCRAALTSPRYGRVFKPANLGILERNVASSMSISLSRVHTLVGSVPRDEIETTLRKDAATAQSIPTPPSEKVQKSRMKEKAVALKQKRSQPCPATLIDPGNIKLHGAFPATSQAAAAPWRVATRQYMQAYREIEAVSKIRSAHENAWQAAFTFLYQAEMDSSLLNPQTAPRHPTEHAIRVARIKVGQPRPRAEKRFLVEAFWASINIRFTLAALARVWLDAISMKEPRCPDHEKQVWGQYIRFLYNTCDQDAQQAVDIASGSESHRQVMQSELLAMRAKLERFQFNVHMFQKTGPLNNRDALISRAAESVEEATKNIGRVLSDYKASMRSVPRTREQDTIEKDFNDAGSAIVTEWQAIENGLRRRTVYELVSMEEKLSIVKALDFSHTGHFYNCPNGHTFIITECGGATEQARCPECGEAIGGSGHVLTSTNTRAMDFEELARVQGAQRSPWGWGM